MRFWRKLYRCIFGWKTASGGRITYDHMLRGEFELDAFNKRQEQIFNEQQEILRTLMSKLR